MVYAIICSSEFVCHATKFNRIVSMFYPFMHYMKYEQSCCKNKNKFTSRGVRRNTAPDRNPTGPHRETKVQWGISTYNRSREVTIGRHVHLYSQKLSHFEASPWCSSRVATERLSRDFWFQRRRLRSNERLRSDGHVTERRRISCGS